MPQVVQVTAGRQVGTNLGEVWRYRHLVGVLAARAVHARYKQTFLGIAWIFFEPVLSVATVTFFFRGHLGIQEKGVPYPLFTAVGFILWGNFSDVLRECTNSLAQNRSMIGKVYLPRLVVPLAASVIGASEFTLLAMAVIVLQACLGQPVFVVGIAMLFGSWLVVFMSALGLGLMFSLIQVRFQDFRHLVQLLLRIALFATPVIYNIHVSSSGLRHWLVRLNPLAEGIELARDALFHGVIHWTVFGTVFIESALILIVGIVVFKRNEIYVLDNL